MQFEFPVKLMSFTSEEFDRKKAEYTAKYGYTMHIPGFSDIFKIGLDYKPTAEEVKLYRAKDIDALGFDKYDQIARVMKKKKEAFTRMMSSPTPTWINNIGTTMTFLDDINDSAGTLSVITRTAAHILPKTIGRYLMGPAGWALTAADIVGLAMTIARSPVTLLTKKRDMFTASTTNPFCHEAKVKRAARLRRLKPTKGELIELFQTTNNIFGVGLSLGPILGAVIEAFTGPFRVLQGKKVTVKWPLPDFSYFERVAMTAITAADALNFGDDELSEEDHTKTYLVAEMASHVLYPLLKRYHPLDKIDGVENIILTPKAPTDPLTKLLFEEEGIDPTLNTGYPGAEDTQNSATELMDVTSERGQSSFKSYTENMKRTTMGQLGMQAVNQYSVNAMSLFEGEEATVTQAHPVLKAFYLLLEARLTLAKYTTYSQYQCISNLIMNPPPHGSQPDLNTLVRYFLPHCNIHVIDLPNVH